MQSGADASWDGSTRVAVCIATCRRPRQLDALLTSLSKLDIIDVDLEVCVVDNDSQRSAQSIIEQHRNRGLLALLDDVELEPGYSAVRNRCVSLVTDDIDWVAFIDDDEIASPEWLHALLDAADRHSAQVVAGPIVRTSLNELPAWTDRFLTLDHRATDGAELSYAFTGNLLVRRRLLDDGPFDTCFRFTGGEDVHLTLRLSDEGARIVFAADAVVESVLDESETSLEAIAHNYRQTSASFAHVLLHLGRSRTLLVLRSAARLTLESAIIAIGLACGSPGRSRAARVRRHGALGALSVALLGRAPLRVDPIRHTRKVVDA